MRGIGIAPAAAALLTLGLALAGAAPPLPKSTSEDLQEPPSSDFPRITSEDLQEDLQDSFDDLSFWKAAPADGVALRLGPASGRTGQGLRFDFDFQGHAGYAVARRELPFDLPENYEISFWLKAEAPGVPVNTLEVKLVDPSGQNVWWLSQRDFRFSSEWREVRIKKRKISFAWGPAGGGEIRRAGSLEIVVTAGTGGKGTLLLDDLRLKPLPAGEVVPPPIRFAASSFVPGFPPEALGDGDPRTVWRSARRKASEDSQSPASTPAGNTSEDLQTVSLDFGLLREFGGLTLDWDPDDYALDYDLLLSDDGQTWRKALEVRGNAGRKDRLYLPESEARYARLDLQRSSKGRGYGLAGVHLEPLAFSATKNDFFRNFAQGFPRGTFPRSYHGEQSHWTIVGAYGGPERTLLSEDGALELGDTPASIEPFLLVDGKLLTWSDVKVEQSLEEAYLPLPTVTWTADALRFRISPFAAPAGKGYVLYARYRLETTRNFPKPVRLVLALRPFQVNPPPQFLNRPGGVGEIRTLEIEGPRALLNGERSIVSLTPPTGGGTFTFGQGEVGERLRTAGNTSEDWQTFPPKGSSSDRPAAGGPIGSFTRETYRKTSEDSQGFASGYFAYDLSPAPGRPARVDLAIPLHDGVGHAPSEAEVRAVSVGAQLEAARRFWRHELNRVAFTVPPEAEPLVRVARSNLAYILINRDGPAIHPGARSYQRAWIRDGALISAALLRFGIERPVRDFLEWYAGYQYDDGKIPCCVDRRGADPVPENDSPGEFLFLVAEDYRFTRDRALLERLWPRVRKTVDFLDSLRLQRRTEEYRTKEGGLYFGLLPESISHEGYSSRPAHSYWDDFFALKGLKDAVEIAEALGQREEAARFAALRDEFRADFYRAMAAAIARHGIDFIPGSSDLGDFDATSTTIALNPVDELPNLPQPQLTRTFERYWEEIERRLRGTSAWNAYTPYELRSVGAFVRLGWRDRAHRLLDFFLGDLRPRPWNQWPEIVYRDPRAPGFLGDLPHTWVGSDYLRSFLDLFAYERSEDQALVLGAGVPASWLDSETGVGIRDLRTRYGSLSFSLRRRGGVVTLRISGKSEVPPGGFVLSWPYETAPKRIALRGRRKTTVESRGREIVIRELPVEVDLVP